MLENYLNEIEHIHKLYFLWVKVDNKYRTTAWNTPEDRELYRQKGKILEEAKYNFKNIIKDWLKNQNVEANISIEFYFARPSKYQIPISISRISIWNSEGSIGKPKWLNKISILRDRNIHIARTSQKFLEPFATEFIKFATALRDAVEIVEIKT